jgi:hypothetical protein
MRRVAPNRLSLIFDESEWNNCFNHEFYFVYAFTELRSFGQLFFQNYIFLTILNFKNSFANRLNEGK